MENIEMSNSALTNEDKIKIAARMFYFEDIEAYKDLNHAVGEMRSVSTQMISFVVSPVAMPESGKVKMVNDTGIVISLAADGAINLCTPVEDNEFFSEMEKASEFLTENFTKDRSSAIYAFKKAGWRFVDQDGVSQ